jgi:hypothetical protein
MSMMNGLLGGPGFSGVMAFSDYDEAVDEGPFASKLQLLIDKIEVAVEVLDLYEGECEKRATVLLHPLRSRLPRPVGVALSAEG